MTPEPTPEPEPTPTPIYTHIADHRTDPGETREAAHKLNEKRTKFAMEHRKREDRGEKAVMQVYRNKKHEMDRAAWKLGQQGVTVLTDSEERKRIFSSLVF